MASSMKKVLVLPGDNIGPEIIAEAVKVLEKVNDKFGLGIELDYAHLGGAALDAVGEPCPKETLDKARAADAILLVLWVARNGMMLSVIYVRRRAC